MLFTMSRVPLGLLLVVAGCYDFASLTRGQDLDGGGAPAAGADLALSDRDSSDLLASAADLGAGCGCPTAADPCHTDPVCQPDGTCTASKPRTDGFGYDPNDPLKRCCNGKPVSVNTSENCGACGISCGSQQCLYAHGPHYYCACSSNDQCWSGCCSTAYGLPNVCAAGNCATNQPISCPGNATIDDDAAGPYYCHY
jgi:hypothetical protein